MSVACRGSYCHYHCLTGPSGSWLKTPPALRHTLAAPFSSVLASSQSGACFQSPSQSSSETPPALSECLEAGKDFVKLTFSFRTKEGGRRRPRIFVAHSRPCGKWVASPFCSLGNSLPQAQLKSDLCEHPVGCGSVISHQVNATKTDRSNIPAGP